MRVELNSYIGNSGSKYWYYWIYTDDGRLADSSNSLPKIEKWNFRHTPQLGFSRKLWAKAYMRKAVEHYCKTDTPYSDSVWANQARSDLKKARNDKEIYTYRCASGDWKRE